MKRLFLLFGLLTMAAFVVGCGGNSNLSTISIEYELVESPADSASEPTDTSYAIDFDEATITVAVWDPNVKDDDELTILAADQVFVDGKSQIELELAQSTIVQISVDTGDEEPIKAKISLSVGGSVSMKFLDSPTEYPLDQFHAIGDSNLVLDSGKAFSISGDFSSMDEDLTNGYAEVMGLGFDSEGNGSWTDYGSAFLSDGQFSISAEAPYPAVVSIYVNSSSYYGYGQAVVEPGMNATVESLGENINSLIATVDQGLHKEIFEKWQSSAEYLALVSDWDEAMGEYQQELEQASNPSEDSESTDAIEVEEVTEDTEAEAQSNEDEGSSSESVASTVTVAEGCEHVDLSVAPAEFDFAGTYPYWDAYQAANAFGLDFLESLALEAQDPWIRLLAMDAGAFGYGRESRHESLKVFDELVIAFDDEELVKNRVMPGRESQHKSIQLLDNNESLAIGQKAPEFTLPSFEGEEMVLSELLSDHELVLIDFWASWCGPCIATFPGLKELHADYNSHGFEILGVSVDSTFEDWEGAMIEHELPWLNVGEITEDVLAEGSVSHTYGAQAIPQTYLVDTEGCIVHRDLHPEHLKEFLVERYGEIVEESEAEDETESVDESESDDLAS